MNQIQIISKSATARAMLIRRLNDHECGTDIWRAMDRWGEAEPDSEEWDAACEALAAILFPNAGK